MKGNSVRGEYPRLDGAAGNHPSDDFGMGNPDGDRREISQLIETRHDPEPVQGARNTHA